jgi:hypothetical protein
MLISIPCHINSGGIKNSSYIFGFTVEIIVIIYSFKIVVNLLINHDIKLYREMYQKKLARNERENTQKTVIKS